MRDVDKQLLLTALQRKGAHCKSNTAVIAEIKLESFRPSCSKPRPPSQQYPFVFAFKEASGQPEVSRSGKK
jgi:hypothetical protein